MQNGFQPMENGDEAEIQIDGYKPVFTQNSSPGVWNRKVGMLSACLPIVSALEEPRALHTWYTFFTESVFQQKLLPMDTYQTLVVMWTQWRKYLVRHIVFARTWPWQLRWRRYRVRSAKEYGNMETNYLPLYKNILWNEHVQFFVIYSIFNVLLLQGIAFLL